MSYSIQGLKGFHMRQINQNKIEESKMLVELISVLKLQLFLQLLYST